MATTTQSHHTSTAAYQQSFNSKFEKFTIFLIGRNNYLNVRDLKYVFDRNPKQQQFKTTQQEIVYRKSIEKNLSTYLAVGAVSSVGMNFLVQKIAPKFSSATMGKLILDLTIASLCIGTGLYLSLNATEPDLIKIKKMYFQQKDRHFLQHIRKQGAEYGTGLEGEIKRFLSPKEFDLWDTSEGVKLLNLIQ